jgi:hypothetical protein
VITIACTLWDANAHSFEFSRMYDESWVDKLYRGFERNLEQPFRFVCWTDRGRDSAEPIEWRILSNKTPDYTSCIEPYSMNVPMILVGLDTIVTGNCDDLADYCLTSGTLAVPRDPIHQWTVCNGVGLVPAGKRYLWDDYDGKLSDMEWIASQYPAVIDDIFPGQVRSYRCDVMQNGLGDCRIVYFHGLKKPHEIDELWVKEHWR